MKSSKFTSLCALLFLLLLTDGAVQLDAASSYRQLTSSNPGVWFSQPGISGDIVVFDSTGNFAGANPDLGHEIFTLNLATSVVTQWTSGLDDIMFEPFMTEDPHRFGMIGRANLTGQNPNHFTQIFHLDLMASDFRQLTAFTTSKGFTGRTINLHGDIVSYGTDQAGFQTVFLHGLVGQTPFYNTGDFGAHHPSLNAPGNLVAFSSAFDITGENEDGNFEIFTFDRFTGIYQQITHTTTPTQNFRPSLSNTGDHIAFDSNGSFGGQNPAGKQIVFVWDRNANSVTKVHVDNSGGSNVASFTPKISGDGSRVLFQSTFNLTGQNPEFYTEFFIADRASGIVEQVSNHNVGENLAEAGMNNEGTRVVMKSHGNYTQQNPNRNLVLFVYEFDPEIPIEATLGQPGTTTPSGSHGDPVNTATGDFYFNRTDFNLPGRGIGVSFARSYNSIDATSGPLGRGWTHSYNIRLTAKSDGSLEARFGDGHREYFHSDDNVNFRSKIPGNFNVIIKNTNGSYTLKFPDQNQLVFNSSGRLFDIRDRNGNRVNLIYDSSGRLTDILDPVSRRLVLTYNTSGQIAQIKDPLNRLVKFTYDASGRLKTETNPAGGIMTYTYDATGRITKIVNERGLTLVENTYDSQGRCIQQKDGLGRLTKFEYNTPNSGETRITDPRGFVTIHKHDDLFRLVEETNHLGKKRKHVFTPENTRQSLSDANNHKTSFAYDFTGNLVSITDPAGKKESMTYNSLNMITNFMDPRGFRTRYQYDSKGNLLREIGPLGHTNSYTYTSQGMLASVKNEKGHIGRFIYDTQANLVTVSNSLGKTLKFTYDGLGRISTHANEIGQITTLKYGMNGKIVETVEPLNRITKFTYDAVGNLASVIDARGFVTEYNYDAIDNLKTVKDALGKVTTFTYDGNNNVKTHVDALGRVRTYSYDSVNRLTQLNDSRGNTKYQYDSEGRLTKWIHPDTKATSFAYDSLDRLTSKTLSDSSAAKFTFDANGNRTKMEDAHGTTTYGYDSLNQLKQVTHPGNLIVKYEYDAAGNRSKLIYPDGKAVTYVHDSEGRLTSLKDWSGKTIKFSYNAAGRLDLITYPNGTVTDHNYDSSDRLTSVETRKGGTSLSKSVYKLDSIGNRTEVLRDGSVKLVNTYDGLSRLTQVKRTDLVIPSPVETTSYAYDAVGNRLRVAAPAGTTTNLFDSADRMTKTGTLTFAFDKAGNRTSEALSGGGTIQYTYDSVNRLTKVLTPTREIRYVYDGDGNKVEETIINRSTGAATTWKFLVDPSTPLPVILQELRFDNFGTALKEEIKYLHAGGVLQQVVTPTGGTSAFSYFHADGLGSIVTLTTANGSVGRQIRYDLWGRKETQSGSLRTRFGFTGEQQDLETGLVYLRARWYDPRHGIFLSRDPYQGTKGLPVSMHPYQYVHNNPATLVDPSGLLPGVKSFLGGVGKVGAGLASIPGGIVDAFRPSDGSAGEIIGKIVGGTETIVHTDYGDSGSASRAPVAVGLPSRSPKLVEPAPTRAPRLANPGPTRARATVPTDGPQRLANPVYQPQPPMRSPTTPPNQSAPQARGLVQVQTPASRALRQVESDVVVQSQGKALVLDEYTPVNPASDRK